MNDLSYKKKLVNQVGLDFLKAAKELAHRKKVIDKCTEANIDTRPIVAGNFARKEVVKYFNHEIFGELKVADFIENRGFFVGNHQFDIRDKIDYLKKTLDCVNFNR